ncbi:MAG: NAD+ synthase [Candidatus Omnitrophota bacterium]
MKELEIDAKKITEKLTDFIKEEVRKKGFKRVVLGLSGGLDSSCVAYLTEKALGPKNVLGVIMPYKTSPEADIADAKCMCKKLGIKSKYIEITDMVEAYFKKIGSNDRMRRGNKMARERMSILYDQSSEFNALVVGTSNKSEILLGYGTIHGDTACAINPIGCLYKTQVRQLSTYLGMPSSIIEKTPSAGLWQGQSDEEELGFTYKEVDKLLFYMIDKKYSRKRLSGAGFDEDFICKVENRIEANRFKRCLPVTAKI